MLLPHHAHSRSVFTCRNLSEEGSRTPLYVSYHKEPMSAPIKKKKELQGTINSKTFLACAYTILPLGFACPQQQFARPWRPWIQGATASPLLALHKTKESQVRAKRKAYVQEGRQVPLENFLRISRSAAAKKNLGGQFIGSLSLDLLCFRLGPFWPSTTRVMKEGIGLGRIGWLPIRIANRLPLVPIGQISPTRLTTYEKKVVFSVLNFRLLLDGHHEAFLIVETILPKVPCLVGSPLNRVDLRKHVACTS
ncbi:hypothetical protein Cgig2_000409 [Carnegiea gigantea]|uniref:Uncharacterized protein n=1 Tax=Carnegiea gigantea TaxID=171969 RepID=A0A9Q1H068_9CARY|nr:hypothetical protein Cgig2_000409 [Carnegiea gigantea]